jgi:7-cyano-7-deazaguanine synthase in queuosine biosynthesis
MILLRFRPETILFPVTRDPTDPIEIHSVYVDLGWRSSARAIPAAATMASAHCVSHEVIKLNGDWQRSLTADLLHNAGVYHQGIALHVIGGMYAAKNDIQFVASGLQAGPVASTAEFAAAMASLYATGAKWEPVEKVPKFIFPLQRLKYNQVIQLLKDNPLFPITVTCNEAEACGTCSKCKYRAMLTYKFGLVSEPPSDIPQSMWDAVMNAVDEPLMPVIQ